VYVSPLVVIPSSGPLAGRAPSLKESRKFSVLFLTTQNSSITGVNGIAETLADNINAVRKAGTSVIILKIDMAPPSARKSFYPNATWIKALT
jgi:hypothetical protein